MKETTFTLRLDDSLKTQFSTAAKNSDHNAAQLIRNFMRDYVKKQNEASYDSWFRQQVQIGLDCVKNGDLVSNEEVEADAAAWRKKLQLK